MTAPPTQGKTKMGKRKNVLSQFQNYFLMVAVGLYCPTTLGCFRQPAICKKPLPFYELGETSHEGFTRELLKLPSRQMP